MIKTALSFIFVLAAASIVAAQPTPTQTPAPAKTAPQAPHTNLKVGQAAPEFTLRATDGKTYKLSDFKNKKSIVLAFYVLAFTGG